MRARIPSEPRCPCDFPRIVSRPRLRDAYSIRIATPARCSRLSVRGRRPVERARRKEQARRILDRLVGYKASPILWHSIKTGLSAGRVQTVALRLIVEREREIRAFTPQEYWSIEALCARNGQTFEAALHKVDGHKPQLQNEADAQAVVEAGCRTTPRAPTCHAAPATSASNTT